MIALIKSWFVAPITAYGIEECPVCNHGLKGMGFFQKRRWEVIQKNVDVSIFKCGRCKGKSEWCGTVGSGKPFVYMRIVWPINRMVYRDVLEMAEDSQARYNIALIKRGQYLPKPCIATLSLLNKKDLLKYVKRTEQKLKNIK